MASFVAYVLRTNMSIAGEKMMDDLGLSKIQLGMVLSAFAWGYAIFQFPGGIFGNIVGCRRALTIIAVFWGILTLATGLVPGTTLASTIFILATLIVLRFLMGVVQAPLFPVACGGTIGSWFPVSGWAFPNGLTSTGLTLGAAATAPLIAWLMESLGWRESFVLTAPLAFEGGNLAAAPWMVGAVAASVGGLWCDRLCKRFGSRWGCRIPGIVGLSLAAGLLLLGATAKNPYLAVVFLALSFGCTQLTEGAYWAAAIYVSGKHASTATGVMNTGGNVVGGIGALLVPITAEAFGWVPALATGSVFAIIGVGLWLFVRADKPMTFVPYSTE